MNTASNPITRTRRRGIAAAALGVATTISLGLLAGPAGAVDAIVVGPVQAVPIPAPPPQPKYKVEAISFKAVDESNWDGAWYAPVSDEVYWIFSSVGANGTNTSRKTSVFGDVDSGETRSFSSSNKCVFRTDCLGGTAPAGIGFSIQLWEEDDGDASANLAKTAEYFKKAGDIADYVGAPSWVSSAAGYVSTACNIVSGWLNDDLLGSRTLAYSSSTLASRLPSVGSSFTETRYFGGLDTSGGADYDLTLRVSRVA